MGRERTRIGCVGVGATRVDISSDAFDADGVERVVERAASVMA
jgi:hypothetical protein